MSRDGVDEQTLLATEVSRVDAVAGGGAADSRDLAANPRTPRGFVRAARRREGLQLCDLSCSTVNMNMKANSLLRFLDGFAERALKGKEGLDLRKRHVLGLYDAAAAADQNQL